MPNSLCESITKKIEHKMVMPARICMCNIICASGCLAARGGDAKWVAARS